MKHALVFQSDFGYVDGVAGLIMGFAYSKTRAKKGSLTKE